MCDLPKLKKTVSRRISLLKQAWHQDGLTLDTHWGMGNTPGGVCDHVLFLGYLVGAVKRNGHAEVVKLHGGHVHQVAHSTSFSPLLSTTHSWRSRGDA
jgi:hypothetical protein